jgi:hypothetical protein
LVSGIISVSVGRGANRWDRRRGLEVLARRRHDIADAAPFVEAQ